MPAGIKNHDLWDKAKTQAGPEQGDGYWAQVMTRYKALGGEASTEAEEACASGQMGQLLRAAAESDWRDSKPQFVSLREAQVDRKKRTVRCILITEGPGNLRDRNYYTADFIADAAKKYNGARAYLNHASEAEYKSRPEGDVRELCGFYRDTKVVAVRDKKTGEPVAAVEGTLVLDESRAGNDALAKVEAQLEYSKIFPDSAEEYCGLSISGSGVREGQAEIRGQKWNRIVGVGQADSVDVVTRPARGGAFLALTESAATAQHLPKEESTMLKKLMALTAELTEATKALGEAKTDAAREAAKTKIDTLNKQLRETAATAEADDKKKSDEGDDDMGALKKLLPKGSEEADDAYNERLAKVKAAAKGKESAEPIKKADIFEAIGDITADDLRKKAPRLFEAVASRVRESLAEQGEDIKAVKAELREAKIELQILRDKELATKLLSEAGVPTKLLSIGDLIGKGESEMRREIERVQAMVEAAGGRVAFPAGAKGGQNKGGSSKLSESLATLKQQAGV
jgi:hypothetical protein